MTTISAQSIRHLPLHERHAQKGARFGAFGEWEVPLYYTTILDEHAAVRQAAGLFDISHMGEFWISGPEALGFLEGLLPRPIAPITVGQALYMPLLNEHGGIVDDIIVYRFADDEFLLIVNAGNVAKDSDWIRAHLSPGVNFTDLSEEMGLLALQGPKSPTILERALGGRIDLKYYHFRKYGSGMISRTGYTGEDGFEIMADNQDLPGLWDTLMNAGAPLGLVPTGFGARDTLRLEAAMPLYGHDMNDETTPLEVGINWAVDLTKASFIGKEPLVRQKETGVRKKLIGFEMVGRGIPRQHYEICKKGKRLGEVTSGSFAPTLKKNIGMGFMAAAESQPGNEIEIMIREQSLAARIVPLPFYKRAKK